MNWLSLPSTGSRRTSVHLLHRYYGKLRLLLCLLAVVLVIVPLRYPGLWYLLHSAQPDTKAAPSGQFLDRRPWGDFLPENGSRPPEFPGFPCQHARLFDTGELAFQVNSEY